MKLKKTLTIILYCFIHSLIIFSLEKFVDFDLIKTASAPRLMDQGILLTLPEDIGHSIFLRTDYDDWSNDHYFKKSFYGIYYLILPYHYQKKRVLYRLNINGYFEHDPGHPNYIEDKYGEKISYVNIPDQVIYYRNFPIISRVDHNISKASFKYYNPTAKEVSLVCSIDNMSIFTHIMQKNSEDYWEIDLYFTRGHHYYYFLVDGTKIVDMNNQQKKWHKKYGQLSFFSIP